MGWSIGYCSRWQRDIGYGVPAYCDHPGCGKEIDRGLGYRSQDEDCGCGKFYCREHRYGTADHTHEPPPARHHPRWREHVLSHRSWAQWRAQNPEQVAALEAERG